MTERLTNRPHVTLDDAPAVISRVLREHLPAIGQALAEVWPADGWRHEADVYAEAGQTQPAWADSEALGLCPMVCPDHQRHCDAGDGGHPGRHACSLCEHWRPRRPGGPWVVVIGEGGRHHDG